MKEWGDDDMGEWGDDSSDEDEYALPDDPKLAHSISEIENPKLTKQSNYNILEVRHVKEKLSKVIDEVVNVIECSEDEAVAKLM